MSKSVFFLRLTVFLIMSAVCFSELPAQNNMTAENILDKSAALLNDPKGLSVDFNISGNGLSGKGSIKSSGKKFTISLPDVEVWFNGKDLYTYNKKTRETTVMTPSPAELAEANPLLYVNGYKGNFNAGFSNEKKSGKYIIDLKPAVKNSNFKKISFLLRSTDYVPEKITAITDTGSDIIFDITSFKKGVSNTTTDFEYPKNKYKGIEIIDLR